MRPYEWRSKDADMTSQDPSATPDGEQPTTPPFVLARRTFLFLGALFAAACTTSSSQKVAQSPEPIWPDLPPPPPMPPITADPPAARRADAGGDKRPPAPSGDTLRAGPVPFALSRRTWARGAPMVNEMDPMLPPRWITVHHDGMNPFYGTSEIDTKARLELIRNGHRGKGWGDIGYHFVVDRSGRVWEARSLRYQGAHVKNCNENNVGVMCLGNFEEQTPSAAQIAALKKTLLALRTYYRIPMARVRTHREWPSAHTECPGAALQARMVAIRSGKEAA